MNYIVCWAIRCTRKSLFSKIMFSYHYIERSKGVCFRVHMFFATSQSEFGSVQSEFGTRTSFYRITYRILEIRK